MSRNATASQTAAAAPENPTKLIKKLTIRITDEAALAAAYPQVMETVTTQVPNRQLLREIVKACQTLGQAVPGVDAFYAHEREAEAAANKRNTA